MFRRLLCAWIIISFLSTLIIPVQRVHADEPFLGLPQPGAMVNLSPSYEPVLIKGLKVHPENPFLFDFIIDTGNSNLKAEDARLKTESGKLIKYFLASLTVPEKDLWVNLSPYEKDRMIAPNLGQTQMGRDMLAQDYILKQLTASLIYPGRNLGKTFWDDVYAKAKEMYGTTQIPVNTFNKVWIVADKADVFERGNVAYVVGAHLKVMLEEDYLALSRHSEGAHKAHSIASNIIRQIILPQIEKEVNTGKNFAPLRQMFYSMILASWYKMALKDAILTQIYGNQSKVKVGINQTDPKANEEIFQRYLQAYKKGVFNYIKEDVNQATNEPMPRKYFSGGASFAMLANPAMLHRHQPWSDSSMTGNIVEVTGIGEVSRLAHHTTIDAAMSQKVNGADNIDNNVLEKLNIAYAFPIDEMINRLKGGLSDLKGNGIVVEKVYSEHSSTVGFQNMGIVFSPDITNFYNLETIENTINLGLETIYGKKTSPSGMVYLKIDGNHIYYIIPGLEVPLAFKSYSSQNAAMTVMEHKFEGGGLYTVGEGKNQKLVLDKEGATLESILNRTRNEKILQFQIITILKRWHNFAKKGDRFSQALITYENETDQITRIDADWNSLFKDGKITSFGKYPGTGDVRKNILFSKFLEAVKNDPSLLFEYMQLVDSLTSHDSEGYQYFKALIYHTVVDLLGLNVSMARIKTRHESDNAQVVTIPVGDKTYYMLNNQLVFDKEGTTLGDILGDNEVKDLAAKFEHWKRYGIGGRESFNHILRLYSKMPLGQIILIWNELFQKGDIQGFNLEGFKYPDNFSFSDFLQGWADNGPEIFEEFLNKVSKIKDLQSKRYILALAYETFRNRIGLVWDKSLYSPRSSLLPVGPKAKLASKIIGVINSNSISQHLMAQGATVIQFKNMEEALDSSKRRTIDLVIEPTSNPVNILILNPNVSGTTKQEKRIVSRNEAWGVINEMLGLPSPDAAMRTQGKEISIGSLVFSDFIGGWGRVKGPAADKDQWVIEFAEPHQSTVKAGSDWVRKHMWQLPQEVSKDSFISFLDFMKIAVKNYGLVGLFRWIRRVDYQDSKIMQDILHMYGITDFNYSELRGLRIITPSLLDDGRPDNYINDPEKLKALSSKLVEWLEQQKNILETSDAAMTIKAKSLGGIDLTRSHFQMNVHKEGQGVQMRFDPAMVARIKREGFDGLDFQIQSIVPVINLPLLLGLKASEIDSPSPMK